jgi:methyltransferase family protein
MTASTEKRDCPLCGAPAARAKPLTYGTDDFRVVQCEACDQVFLDRLPPQHEFEDERAWEISSVSHATQRKRDYPLLVAAQRMTRWRMHITKREPKRMLARRARPGPIVDIGCGGGVNLLPPPQGLIPYGIEISKSLAAAAEAAFRPYGGACMQAPAIEGLARFPRGFFNGALLIGYIEHEFRPREALSALRGALADDAVVVVKTPNYASLNRRLMGMRWSGFRFPDHVNYFTPRTLREIARRAGFTTHYGPTDRNPTSDSLWGLLRAA